MSYSERRDEETYTAMPLHIRTFIRVLVWQLNVLNYLLKPLGLSPGFTIYVSDQLEYEEVDPDEFWDKEEEEEKDPIH